MIASTVFFSFTEVPDPSMHRAYNEWHQLDHRPENLALPGVRHGERWVRSPRCVSTHGVESPLDALHYLNMYWYAEPVAASVQEWTALAERSLQWGRRPDLAWANRLLMGFFSAVKGYASPRVLVSADALVFRPNRGVFLTVEEVREPAGAAADDYFAWCDRVLVPRVLADPGVAGAWTFASDPRLGTHAIPALAPGLRVHVYYLDDDPVAIAASVSDRVGDREPHHRGLVRDLYRGPLLSITPWQWDWFDGPMP